jgi:tetrachlorobenzoquinone reductase
MSPEVNHGVELQRIDDLAEDIRAFELCRVDGGIFTPAGPGAHVRLTLPSGLRRCYSLVNAPNEDRHLQIAVQLDPASRGGSKELFSLAIGDTLTAAEPDNTFALADDDEDVVLIAGGIGITPIWSMIQHLEQAARPWRLYYGARSPRSAAYRTELQALERSTPGRVVFAFSSEGQRLDLPAAMNSAGERTGVYCCGPDRIIKEFRARAAGLGERAHFEDFTPAEIAEGGFEVHLARSNMTLVIPEGQSILDAALEAGLEPEYSCTSGTCGSCVTTVLDGEPDHRDYFLTDQEKAPGDRMMICCSGCRIGPLVLDL